MRRAILSVFTIILVTLCLQPVSAAVKPVYGGTLKVADELLAPLGAPRLFSVQDGVVRPLYPFPLRVDGATLTMDLGSLNPDVFTELEKSVALLQDPASACHWILDYPYYSHRHATTIEAADNKLIIKAETPEILAALAASPCLMPQPVEAFLPYVKTQFSYEANANCLAGRPFLDAITPAPVDPVNPYLSFKLNDADVIPVPEDRFQQISRDPDVTLLPGPRTFLFLRSDTVLSPETAAAISSALRVTDLARAVLNGHAEPLLVSNTAPSPRPGTRLHLDYPADPPYRLIGERIELELRDAGFDVTQDAPTGAILLHLETAPVTAGSEDLMRYQLLRKSFPAAVFNENTPWPDLWNEYQANGRILPLLVHTTFLAVRNTIQNLEDATSGLPDFPDAWLEKQP